MTILVAGIDGMGTRGYVPRFLFGGVIINSSLYDDMTNGSVINVSLLCTAANGLCSSNASVYNFTYNITNNLTTIYNITNNYTTVNNFSLENYTLFIDLNDTGSEFNLTWCRADGYCDSSEVTDSTGGAEADPVALSYIDSLYANTSILQAWQEPTYYNITYINDSLSGYYTTDNPNGYINSSYGNSTYLNINYGGSIYTNLSTAQGTLASEVANRTADTVNLNATKVGWLYEAIDYLNLTYINTSLANYVTWVYEAKDYTNTSALQATLSSEITNRTADITNINSSIVASQFNYSKYFNQYLNTTNTISAANINVSGIIYVGNNATEGDKHIYIYNGGSSTGESINWLDSNDVFSFSDEIVTEGVYSTEDIRTGGAGDDLWLGSYLVSGAVTILYANGTVKALDFRENGYSLNTLYNDSLMSSNAYTLAGIAAENANASINNLAITNATANNAYIMAGSGATTANISSAWLTPIYYNISYLNGSFATLASLAPYYYNISYLNGSFATWTYIAKIYTNDSALQATLSSEVGNRSADISNLNTSIALLTTWAYTAKDYTNTSTLQGTLGTEVTNRTADTTNLNATKVTWLYEAIDYLNLTYINTSLGNYATWTYTTALYTNISTLWAKEALNYGNLSSTMAGLQGANSTANLAYSYAWNAGVIANSTRDNLVVSNTTAKNAYTLAAIADAKGNTSIGGLGVTNTTVNVLVAKEAIAYSNMTTIVNDCNNIYQHHVNNTFYDPSVIGVASPTSTLIANAYFATPFYVCKAYDIDQLRIIVTTAAAGKYCAIGIYNDNGNTYPYQLVVNGSRVSVNDIRFIETNVTRTTLTQGLYWAVINCDGTPTVRGLSTYSYSSILGHSGAATTNKQLSYFVYNTTGAMLHGTFPTTAELSTTANFAGPNIFWRVVT